MHPTRSIQSPIRESSLAGCAFRFWHPPSQASRGASTPGARRGTSILLHTSASPPRSPSDGTGADALAALRELTLHGSPETADAKIERHTQSCTSQKRTRTPSIVTSNFRVCRAHGWTARPGLAYQPASSLRTASTSVAPMRLAIRWNSSSRASLLVCVWSASAIKCKESSRRTSNRRRIFRNGLRSRA